MKSRCVFPLVVLGLLMTARHTFAADREQRDYVIYVDGKESGRSTMVITRQDDGVTYMTAAVQLKFQQLIFNYSLSIDSAEWWKEGKLIGLKCTAQENSKKTEVVVATEGEQLRARINGQERPLPADVWTSSFWKLADARFHNKTVPVFEGDTGKDYQAQLQYVGAEQLTFLGRPQNSFHFRVQGPTVTDLWFDQYHRLVRQEFTELGHKTIVQLSNVKR